MQQSGAELMLAGAWRCRSGHDPRAGRGG